MPEAPTSRLMVLLFTDIVGSVDLKTRLGADKAARLISRHDDLVRRTVQPVEGAELLKDTGDGYLVRFATASDAVKTCLRLQWALHHEPWDPEPIRVRMGLNIGQVSELEREPSGTPKLTGLAVDLAARIMDLAQPSQLLMTRTAFDDARQYVREHPPVDGGAEPDLKWMAHGPYLFKGADEPINVCEVGAVGIAPLEAPPDSTKAQRSVAAQDEETLGWRPAAGLPVPERKGWILDHKLGEGGFGEVWLARHKRTMSTRVFKFCFDADRVRSLKRELTLFRMLREALGDRKDIARLYEVQLEEPPYFLESEYTEHGSLIDWASAKEGGIASIPQATRIDVVARTARAVAAAHSVGILHKDIKPANILVYDDEDGHPRPQLADFGIGALEDARRLEGSPVTVVGFTDELAADMTTTQMYAPPEMLAGRPFTALGDIYALGVLLFQMTVGDFTRPLAQGWERSVPDPMLRHDIAVCVEGIEEQRIGSAQGLAKRLESLPQRRRANRRRRIVRGAAVASGVLAVLLAVSSVLFVHEGTLRREAEAARDAERAINTFITEMLGEVDPLRQQGREVRVVDFLENALEEMPTRFPDLPDVQAGLLTTIGSVYKHLGLLHESREPLRQAYELGQTHLEPPHPLLARTAHNFAAALAFLGDTKTAEPLYLDALAMRRRLHDGPHEEIAETLHHLGFVSDVSRAYDASDAYYAEALVIRRGLGNELGVAATLQAMARSLTLRGDYEKAVPHFEEALRETRRLRGADSATVAVILHNFAKCLQKKKEMDGSEAMYRDAIRIKRLELGETHSLAASLNGLAALLLERSRPDEAESLGREAVEIYRAQQHQDLPKALRVLSRICEALNKIDEARALADEADRLASGRPDPTT